MCPKRFSIHNLSTNIMRKLLIQKQESSYETTTEQDTADYTFETDTEFDTEENGHRNYGLKHISTTGYVRPTQTYQDRLTKDDIRKRLEGYVPLKTMEEKKQLLNMTPFKTYIKYFHVPTRKFRVGGLLLKVCYPDYIMLVNPSKNLTWAVNLKENLIYVPHPKKLEEQALKKQKEKEIKERLFDLYQKGQLTTKRN